MNKVSIITRTKNREILLRRAVRSVLSQSHEDWEMIIVNDGGTPSPVDQLLTSVAESAKGRIKVIHNPESLGMEAASNKGIEQASGDYMVIHDDDDSWTPEFLKIGLRELQQQKARWPAVRGVVSRAVRVLEEIKGDEVITHKLEKFRPDVRVGLIPLNQLLHENVFAPIQFIYERSVITEIGNYREDLPVLGDWEFNIRFARKYDIAQISDETALYHHRIADKSSAYGNSVIAGHDKHLFYNQALKNEWLRHDLETGCVGVSNFHGPAANPKVDVGEIQGKIDMLIRYNFFLGLKSLEKKIRHMIRGR